MFRFYHQSAFLLINNIRYSYKRIENVQSNDVIDDIDIIYDEHLENGVSYRFTRRKAHLTIGATRYIYERNAADDEFVEDVNGSQQNGPETPIVSNSNENDNNEQGN